MRNRYGYETAPHDVEYVMRFFPVGEDSNITNFALAREIVREQASFMLEETGDSYYAGLLEGVENTVLIYEGHGVGLR